MFFKQDGTHSQGAMAAVVIKTEVSLEVVLPAQSH